MVLRKLALALALAAAPVAVPAVSKHIANIYDQGELEPAATVSKMEIVRLEGGRQVQRQIDHYNLDVILSVGYRVSAAA